MNEFEQCISEWADRCREKDALITQQAQELERVKERLRRYNHWTPEHTIEEWLADRQRIVDAKQVEADAQLQATLAAAQARLTEYDRWLQNGVYFTNEEFAKHVADHKATLAAREAPDRPAGDSSPE